MITDDQYQKGLAIATRYTSNIEDSKEIVQNSVVKALTTENIKNLPIWFNTVVRNAAINRVTRKREIASETAYTGHYEDEVGFLMRDSYRKLKTSERQILWLSVVEGYNPVEIGALLGINRSTAIWRRKKALEKLRRLYEKV